MDIKSILKKKNLKYWVAIAFFALLLLFIDENNLMVTAKLYREVNQLHAEEEQLREDIVQDSINAATISSSLDAKEHYGREHYYMKRPNEDIFVIK